MTDSVQEGDLLWTPSAQRIERAHLTHYLGWLAARGRRFDSYAALWQWSIDDLDGFWGSLWDYFAIQTSQPYQRVLGKRDMPGAEWFPGALLNYAEHALRHERSGADALLFLSERRRHGIMRVRERHEREEIFIPREILGIQEESIAILNARVEADDGLEALRLALFIKLNSAVEVIAVGERERRGAALLGGLHQLGYLGQRLEKRVVRVHVQVYELRGHLRSILRSPRLEPVLLQCRNATLAHRC